MEINGAAEEDEENKVEKKNAAHTTKSKHQMKREPNECRVHVMPGKHKS